MPIQRLTEEITRKIAAGEVIDRPASVLKELIENAIDAESERIEIELAEGGTSAIIVRDDGDGMDEEDLGLSIERYATSKIRDEDDLSSIRTLGFRGEALASVAAVSRLSIVSRASGRADAFRLTAVAGAIEPIQPAARAPGTTVEVLDLFFNVPARARFLGSPRTEFLHAHRTVQAMAVVWPEISWMLRHGEREAFAAPAVEALLDRIGQVYGSDIARGMIPIAGQRGEIRISGFVSKPELKRGNRRDQLFIVNRRLVSDRGLSYVLASAYRGILRPGTYPLALVQIDVPPDRVDVNVHPRKEEVRFADSRQIQDALGAALQQSLSQRHVVGSLLPEERTSADRASAVRSPGPETLPFDLPTQIERSRSLRATEKVSADRDRRVLGQLHNTYLLVETADGLDIVDQHIAHERVLYERLCRELREDGIARQIFLLPVRIEAPFEAAEILADHAVDLERVGIALQAFGGGTFLLREYPQMLAEEQSRRGFQELMGTLAEVLRAGGAGALEAALFDRLLAELACAAAIKAGDRIPPAEAQHLLESLMGLENPYACPHGRPIIFSLDRRDLDRRFQRH